MTRITPARTIQGKTSVVLRVAHLKQRDIQHKRLTYQLKSDIGDSERAVCRFVRKRYANRGMPFRFGCVRIRKAFMLRAASKPPSPSHASMVQLLLTRPTSSSFYCQKAQGVTVISLLKAYIYSAKALDLTLPSLVEEPYQDPA